MLKRKITEKLLRWKESNNEMCLLLEGARQVGKTFIVRAFGKEHYESFIELNFLENPSLKSIFDGALDDKTILTGIRLNSPGAKAVPGQTLVFLDEIQECPNAITALKFLAQSKDVDVIASGSALGIAYNRVTSYPVGYVEHLLMKPLDFREFLWAQGVEEETILELKSYFDQKKKVPPAIDEAMMNYLKQYMVVGGMPQIVSDFAENKNYSGVHDSQRRIYQDYIADIARYAKPDVKIKAEECFASIPVQLTKENHKFQYKTVRKGGTTRMFESSIDWLKRAHMVIPATNVSRIEFPLQSFEIENNTRLYMNDIGLLVGTYDYSLKQELLRDEMDSGNEGNPILRIAKGGLYEALAAVMLDGAGYENLHFYRSESGSVEMEFLIETADGISPVEIKAGKSKSRSLGRILESPDIKHGYKFCGKNVGYKDKKITMPLYMLMFV